MSNISYTFTHKIVLRVLQEKKSIGVGARFEESSEHWQKYKVDLSNGGGVWITIIDSVWLLHSIRWTRSRRKWRRRPGIKR